MNLLEGIFAAIGVFATFAVFTCLWLGTSYWVQSSPSKEDLRNEVKSRHQQVVDQYAVLRKLKRRVHKLEQRLDAKEKV